MKTDQNEIMAPNEFEDLIVQSSLWEDTANFTHKSWIVCDGDFQKLSHLARRMLMSSLLELPQSKTEEDIEMLDLRLFERFVNSPVRFLLLAGIAANPECKVMGFTKNPQLLMDEGFSHNLGLTFSMKERFNFSDQDNRTAIQTGLLLFYKLLMQKHECVWNICRLSLDKRLINSLDYSTVTKAGAHTAALAAYWVQIDHYLSKTSS